jgi:hypothetical protein
LRSDHLYRLANTIREQQAVPLDRDVSRFAATGVQRSNCGFVMTRVWCRNRLACSPECRAAQSSPCAVDMLAIVDAWPRQDRVDLGGLAPLFERGGAHARRSTQRTPPQHPEDAAVTATYQQPARLPRSRWSGRMKGSARLDEP